MPRDFGFFLIKKVFGHDPWLIGSKFPYQGLNLGHHSEHTESWPLDHQRISPATFIEMARCPIQSKSWPDWFTTVPLLSCASHLTQAPHIGGTSQNPHIGQFRQPWLSTPDECSQSQVFRAVDNLAIKHQVEGIQFESFDKPGHASALLPSVFNHPDNAEADVEWCMC